MRRHDNECVFCIKTAFSSKVVEHFEPLNPVVPGHRLFVPTEHVENAGTKPEITAEVMRIASAFAGEFYDSYNLITSAGRSATQSVFHLHIHLVPRYDTDGLHLPWTGQAKA